MITIIIKEREMQAATARNTRQKTAVAEAVLCSCDHPTAETVFERARERVPGISLGTVYRVLGTLTREGRVREITVPGAPSRFDKTTSCHAHFLCTACGAVNDVKLDGDLLTPARAACRGADVNEAEIVFKGVCARCKEERYESAL